MKFAFVAPVSSAPIPIASLSFEEVPAESILPRIPREKREESRVSYLAHSPPSAD